MEFVENLTVAIIFFTTSFSQKAPKIKIKLKAIQGLRLCHLQSFNIIGKPTSSNVVKKSVRYFKL